MKKSILFINNVNAACGVYQHGRLVYNLLEGSTDYTTHYRECDNIRSLSDAYNTLHPDIIIYNYHPALFQFLADNYMVLRSYDNTKHIGLITDGTADVLLNPEIHDNLRPLGPVGTAFCPQIFDRYLFMDPETVETQYIKHVLPTIPYFDETKSNTENRKITVGSFGFGGQDKGFDDLIKMVESEFDEAIIKVHIPFATYGDSEGVGAKARVNECLASITKPGIELEATHDFMPESAVLDYLHSNDINIFLYNDIYGSQGIASTPHFAIAVNKPFLVSNTSKTRHLIGVSKEVDENVTSIKLALELGTKLVAPFREVWSRNNTLASYEKVFNELLQEEHFYGASTPPIDNILASAFPLDYKGVCIDIGAGDGKLGSNTMYFERRGWNCLCIEPNPVYVDYLNACRDKVVVAAITNDTTIDTMPLKVIKVITTEVHDGDPPHQYGALTSLRTDEKLYERFKNNGHILEEYDVPTRVMTLTKCIEENNFPTYIDFISIDTEGTELDILKSIDFEKIHVSVFVIENNFKTNDIEEYLLPYGYIKYLSHEENDFFILESLIN